MKEYFRSIVVWLLTLEAQAIVKKYKPHIILVTGSVGKTTAKDAAYSAVSTTHFVRRSEKSFNSDIGAPLTILGVPNGWANPITWIRNLFDGLFLIILKAQYPEWLIVEVGADRPGDISKSLAWLRPEVVVATRFPAVPVHVEFYDSPEAVQAEELAPVSWLRPGGTLVGNHDDELVADAVVPDGVEKISYGLRDGADLVARNVHVSVHNGMPVGMTFVVEYKSENVKVALEGVIGEPQIYATLAGIGAALAIGVPLATAAGAFTDHGTPPGRMKLVPGTKGTVIIDDSYNASPIAAVEALKALKDIPRKGRRIAVLGDMLELGSYSVAEHEKVGTLVSSSADLLVTVGVRARSIASSAEKAGMQSDMILQFDKALDAAEHLLSVIAEGDVILVKGSQGMRMERVSKLLMANPSDAKKYLPRQDAEWLTR